VAADELFRLLRGGAKVGEDKDYHQRQDEHQIVEHPLHPALYLQARHAQHEEDDRQVDLAGQASSITEMTTPVTNVIDTKARSSAPSCTVQLIQRRRRVGSLGHISPRCQDRGQAEGSETLYDTGGRRTRLQSVSPSPVRPTAIFASKPPNQTTCREEMLPPPSLRLTRRRLPFLDIQLARFLQVFLRLLHIPSRHRFKSLK
jgi:hypothetical protein